MLEVARVQHDVEVDARFAEGVETHGWLHLDVLVDAAHDLMGNIECHALDLVEIAVVGDADRDADDDVFVRHAVVRDVRRGNLLVWDDDHVAAAGRHDRREAPGDVCDAALFTRVELDVVIEAQLFGDDQVEA